MNSLELIGVFTCVIAATAAVWAIFFLLNSNASDVDEKCIFASFGTIIILIIALTIFISEYKSTERKIDEYKEKLSKYEKLEAEE